MQNFLRIYSKLMLFLTNYAIIIVILFLLSQGFEDMSWPR